MKRIKLTLICLSLLYLPSAWAKNLCHPYQHIVAKKNGKNVPLEPSGLVYIKAHDIYIAVSDNFNDLHKLKDDEYTIFWFKDDGAKTLIAHPLLTKAFTKEAMPYDLESMTMDKNGVLYALGSLALHPTKSHRDTWFRSQGFHFDIKKISDNKFALSHFDALSENKYRILRSWLSNHKKLPWTLKHIRGRAETENGINIEALSITPDDNLLLGFRGPLLKPKGVPSSIALEIKVGLKKDSVPQLVDVYHLTHETLDASKANQGFRGLVPNKPWWFVVLTGAHNRQIDLDFQLLLWNPKTNEIKHRTYFDKSKDSQVWEGLAVTHVMKGQKRTQLKLALVDDRNACFKTILLPSP